MELEALYMDLAESEIADNYQFIYPWSGSTEKKETPERRFRDFPDQDNRAGRKEESYTEDDLMRKSEVLKSRMNFYEVTSLTSATWMWKSLNKRSESELSLNKESEADSLFKLLL